MGTIITDRNLLGILKGAELLARQMAPRYAHLFAEQPTAQQPTSEEAAHDSSALVPPTDHHQRAFEVVRPGG